MDSVLETFYYNMSEFLLSKGVGQHVLDKLTEDEVDPSVPECNSAPCTPKSSPSGSVDGSYPSLPVLPQPSTPLSNASSSASLCNSRSSSPMMLFNDTDSSFSGTEVSRNNTKWVQNFKLPIMGSWEAIKNHIKNKRKTKRNGIKRSTPTTKRPDVVKPKKINSGKLPEMAEGETEETCKEHISLMKKEMKKTTNRKMALIKNLMEQTYPHRKQSILLQPTAIDVTIKEYPALGLASEVW